MGGYDLMWNDGPVYIEDVTPETFGSLCFTANTHLGNQTGKNFFEATKPLTFGTIKTNVITYWN